MKKIFTVMLIASAFFSVSASAQKMSMPKQTLMDSLKISAVTADSVIAIQQQTMKQMKTVMNDESLSKDEKKEKAKPIKEEMKTSLKKFLNNNQLAKLQEMQMEMRQNKKNQ